MSIATKTKRLPINIDNMDVAFSGRVQDILPPIPEIPAEYEGRRTWERWQEDWFFNGLKRYPVAKAGIDLQTAMRNLRAVQGSWSPKHEHKRAGIAYLASLWFSSPDGELISA